MDYKTFAEHTETYKINGTYYKTTVNFITDQIFIKSPKSMIKKPLSEYTNYTGNMEEYVTNIVR